MTPRAEVLTASALLVLALAVLAGVTAPMYLGAARVVAHPEPCACECVP